MAAGGVRVEGLSRAVRQLKALGLDVEDLKAAFATIATEAAARAAAHAPKRSGRLAASVRGNRAQSKAIVRAGRAAVPYAGPINYGWPRRSIAPARFMQAADTEMQPIAVSMLEADINRAIRNRGLNR